MIVVWASRYDKWPTGCSAKSPGSPTHATMPGNGCPRMVNHGYPSTSSSMRSARSRSFCAVWVTYRSRGSNRCVSASMIMLPPFRHVRLAAELCRSRSWSSSATRPEP